MASKETSSRISSVKKLVKTGIVGVLALTGVSATSNAASRAPDEPYGQLPESLKQKVINFQGELLAKGYEVAKGDFHLFTIDDCKYAISTIGNCLGNNPTAPYIIPTVPLWPDEFVDNNMKDLFGPVAEKHGWTHRLDPQEAIVVLAVLPPTGRYFGFQPYVFSREGSLNTSDPIYSSLSDPFMKSILFMNSPNPIRPLVFSSIGDSINNVVIEKQSGSAFDQQRFFVMTSDAKITEEVSEALMSAGVPDSKYIFNAPIPTSLARVGLDSKSDDFMSLIRYALPKDEVAGEKWRHQLPLVVLRVRHKDPGRIAQVYPMGVRETRIANSEVALKSHVDNLVAAVKEKAKQSSATDSEFRSLLLSMDLIGEHCLGRSMNCLGDTGDADYQISETATLDHGELLAVVGTLGTATGNATYTSLAVNRLPELVGSFNLSDLDLLGTAAGYSTAVQNTDKLYVVYFARDCGQIAHCHSVTEQMVPHGGSLKLIQRNYIVPGSKRGPLPEKVVNPRMIILKK